MNVSNAERISLDLNHPGRNAIPYVDEDRNSDRPFTLHTYRPYNYTADRPVVFVQHGVLRNGDDYRDFWIPAAHRPTGSSSPDRRTGAARRRRR